MRIVHETFGRQTIDEFLYNTGPNSNKFSERYNCNNIEFYQPPKSELKEPTKEEKSLRDKMINEYPENFVEKLGLEDRIRVPPIKFEIDKRKAEQMRPTNHIKPYDVP